MNNTQKQKKLLALEEFQNSFNYYNYDCTVEEQGLHNKTIIELLDSMIDVYRHDGFTEHFDEADVNDLPEFLIEKTDHVANLLVNVYNTIESIRYLLERQTNNLSENNE
ncbi:hypothetical protein [Candidatus Phytoplasma pruni]|uniref:Uncharacterized protein n=1 Tax=Candidatus Phytoplasma pruni TaxID=479893 RepID=A0A851H9G3_9MOLU|nr:hypothetical protein [Candidatus Phytoplasma pruni]NWN45507.1 hypothetical protein [Candidatus Phytoplasma pruni]